MIIRVNNKYRKMKVVINKIMIKITMMINHKKKKVKVRNQLKMGKNSLRKMNKQMVIKKFKNKKRK